MSQPIAIFSTILLLLLTSPLAAAATHPAFVLEGSEIHSLNSKFTGETHELAVSLPASYQARNAQTYPVLYFLDAYWDMPLVYALYGNLQFDKAAPEMILVGLSLPKGREYGQHRNKFFSPSTIKPGDTETGQAQRFYNMLTDETIPYIESHFRAAPNPQQRALAGQSMGGLFTLFAMYQTPQVFTRFISINPAAMWDDNFMLKMDDAFFTKHKRLPARVFISHGSNEYPVFRKGIIAFKKQLQSRHYQDLDLLNYTLAGMRHTGGKGEAYTRGILWTFLDLAPNGKSGLQQVMESQEKLVK